MPVHARLGVAIRVLRLQAVAERREIAGDLRRRDAVPQMPEHDEVLIPALVLEVLPRDGDPHVRGILQIADGVIGKSNTGWHDTDDRAVDAAEADRASDHRWVGPVAPPPQSVADDHDAIAADVARHAVRVRESASARRRHAEQLEQIR